MEDNIGLSLLPYSVSGTDPGSIYRVVARTANHYVAVRRLAENVYRVRVARIDDKPLDIRGTSAELWATKFDFKIGENWKYMSIRALSAHSATDVISRLIRVAMISDETLENMPNDNTDEGQAIENFVKNGGVQAMAATPKTDKEENSDKLKN